MKKTYEKPALRTEPFDVGDVITLSEPGNPVQNLLNTVGNFMENMVDMFNSLGQ